VDHLSYGYATPMRGKSPTCREHLSSFFGVFDPILAVIDRVFTFSQRFRHVIDSPRIGVAKPLAE
jgi:hypothetical protein